MKKMDECIKDVISLIPRNDWCPLEEVDDD